MDSSSHTIFVATRLIFFGVSPVFVVLVLVTDVETETCTETLELALALPVAVELALALTFVETETSVPVAVVDELLETFVEALVVPLIDSKSVWSISIFPTPPCPPVETTTDVEAELSADTVAVASDVAFVSTIVPVSAVGVANSPELEEVVVFCDEDDDEEEDEELETALETDPTLDTITLVLSAYATRGTTEELCMIMLNASSHPSSFSKVPFPEFLNRKLCFICKVN